MDVTLTLTLPGEALSVSVVRRLLGDALRGMGVLENCVADILIAASEACSNAVRYAAGPAGFDVAINIDHCRCTVTVTDHGQGIRDIDHRAGAPLADPVEPPDASSGEVRESGRGISIMRAAMDDVVITGEPGVGTTVHLCKLLAWREQSPIHRLDREPARAAR